MTSTMNFQSDIGMMSISPSLKLSSRGDLQACAEAQLQCGKIKIDWLAGPTEFRIHPGYLQEHFCVSIGERPVNAVGFGQER